jgi:actin-related protein
MEEQPKKKRLKAKELYSEINNDNRMIIIDNGSDTIKIGFSGEDTPRVDFKYVLTSTLR